MPIAYITRRERFCAAHRLFNPGFSDEQNEAIYGECSNEHWHGHNFELLVTVRGPVNPQIGYVVNLKVVSQIIKERVISKLDHRNLNLDVDFMHGQIPSTENLAVAIWAQLEAPMNDIGVELHCVRVQETENNYVEYFGD